MNVTNRHVSAAGIASVLFAVVVATGAWFAVVSRSQDAPAGGATGFVSSQVDLGDQFWHRTIPVPLVFRNASHTALPLEAIAVSCGCTLIDSAEYVGQSVNPSESVTLDVSLETGAEPGDKVRTVTLIAGGRKYAADIRVNVVGTFALDRKVISFGEVEPTLTDERVEVAHFDCPSQEVELVGEPQLDGRWLEAAYFKNGDGSFQIAVRLLPERLAVGLNVGAVRIDTTDASIPMISFRVLATLAPDLRGVPSHVILREGEEKIVRFYCKDGSPAPIVSYEQPESQLNITVEEGGALRIANPVGTRILTHPVTVRLADGAFGRVLVSTFGA
jgi:hypothetical protein